MPYKNEKLMGKTFLVLSEFPMPMTMLGKERAKTLQILLRLSTDKYRSQPSTKKCLLVTDEDNYRKPQPIKMQRMNDCVVPNSD